MTHTVQHNSAYMLSETDKNLTGNNGETEDDISLLLSVYDNLKNLSMALDRMDNIQNKLFKKLTKLEQIVHNI